MTDYWAWVCTDRRVLKYKTGSSGSEQLHDVSFDEISAISLVNTGRNDKIGGYGGFAIVLSVLILLPFGGPETFAVSLILLAIGGYLIYRWMNSEKSYFQFRGSGLIQTEEDRWRIDETAAENPAEIREFVKTVREQF
ncbi:hypothetical protein [Haloplanus halophilus]|uniref:hypothetical protein n=1 Tax=Haloplanus halophilus TaxID=2949993 RepID=UPI00203EDA3A|nr:hypothetical protein [Haloplanus sp. GDY1]